MQAATRQGHDFLDPFLIVRKQRRFANSNRAMMSNGYGKDIPPKVLDPLLIGGR